MRTISTALATLRRRRTTTASLARRVIAVLQRMKKVSREYAYGTTNAVNWLTSVIERLANFSSRFAWPLPFTAFWGGERKRPTRPTTCPSAKTWGKRQSSLKRVQRCKKK